MIQWDTQFNVSKVSGALQVSLRTRDTDGRVRRTRAKARIVDSTWGGCTQLVDCQVRGDLTDAAVADIFVGVESLKRRKENSQLSKRQAEEERYSKRHSPKVNRGDLLADNGLFRIQ